MARPKIGEPSTEIAEERLANLETGKKPRFLCENGSAYDPPIILKASTFLGEINHDALDNGDEH